MLGIARVNQRNYAILAMYSKELPNKNDVDLGKLAKYIGGYITGSKE